MKDDINPTQKKDRNFQYTDERLNDRESVVAENEPTTQDEELLKKYPREPIHKDIMNEEQVNSVQERVRADHQSAADRPASE
jgi:hypothetical protein